MALFLQFARYSPVGMERVLETGMAARREAVQRAVEAAGGRLLRFDMVVGGTYDFVQLVEVPDAATLLAINAVGAASGAFDVDRQVYELCELEAFDARRSSAGPTAYRSPVSS
jgi:uncharacterized protein with GYD domain